MRANVAILSCAHIHTKTFIEDLLNGNDGRRLVAIWDDVPERGQRYAEQAGVPFVPSLEAVLADPAVDGFVICAENTGHMALLERVIPLGKPVFCEKPLVTGRGELRKLQALLNGKTTPIICGYFFPFQGALRAVSSEIGALGEVTRVSFRLVHGGAYLRWFDHPDLSWFTRRESAGHGGFLDLGTHALHLLRTWFGPVRQVWAEIGNHSGIYPEVDDYGVAHLRFASGVLGCVEAGWTQVAGGEVGLSVVGSQGAIWKEQGGYVIGRAEGEPAPIPPTESVEARVNRLIRVIRGEVAPEALAADLAASMDAVRVIEAAYESAACGRWVDIE